MRLGSWFPMTEGAFLLGHLIPRCITVNGKYDTAACMNDEQNNE